MHPVTAQNGFKSFRFQAESAPTPAPCYANANGWAATNQCLFHIKGKSMQKAKDATISLSCQY
jgi:hypothetical protein